MSPINGKSLRPEQPRDKLVAWNEISLQVPGTWEIEQLDKTYLFLGGDGSPQMELKWTQSPPRSSLETHIKNFVSQCRRQLGITIREEAVPSFFSHPEPGFEFFFFSWQGGGGDGWGVTVFCCHCRKLSLIRFFDSSCLSPGSPAEQILGSYSDHPAGSETTWAVFGMKFALPSAFNLVDYRFQPGSFSLNFACQKTALSVFSWGPASFLLSKTDLNGFARQRVPGLLGLALAGECRKGAFLEWTYREEPFRGAGRLPGLKMFTRCCVFRICTDIDENRIFGILTRSSRQFERGLIRESFLGDL